MFASAELLQILPDGSSRSGSLPAEQKNIQHVFIKTDRGEPYRTPHGCRPDTGSALGKAGSAGMKKCPEVHGRLTRGLRAAVSYCFPSPVTRFSRSRLLSQEGTEGGGPGCAAAFTGSGKPHRGPPVEETKLARLHEMKVQGLLTWDRP